MGVVIDLHTHTTASDGSDSPKALVESAVAAGVTVLGLTDHDTTAGWAAARDAVAGLSVPFTLITGTEFSCVHDGADGRPISLHLLGYLFDPEHESLRLERARLRTSRIGRGKAIVDNLVAAGHPVAWTRVAEIADGGSVGRPHIGQALVEAGVVGSVNEAFAELLSDSSPYYVHKQDMAVMDAISLIRAAGGVSVIAHPWARRRGRILSEQDLAQLVEAGLGGFEVDHVDHTAPDRRRLRELAAELGVVVTGSSDYHGDRKDVRLGAEQTDPAVLEHIVAISHGAEPIRSSAR